MEQNTPRNVSLLSSLISTAEFSESDLILSAFDDASKLACFEQFWAHLQSTGDNHQFDALRLCIRLLPQGDQDDAAYVKLSDFILSTISKASAQTEQLYKLSGLCLGNSRLSVHVCRSILDFLSTVIRATPADFQDHVHQELETAQEQQTTKAVAYLNFLKCSYWHPPDQYHHLTPDSVYVLCQCIGVEGLDDAAQDALSALLSLIQDSSGRIRLPAAAVSTNQTFETADYRKVVSQQLWNRYGYLSDDYFASTSKTFKTWFQWVSVATTIGVEIDGVYEFLYWSRLRSGLLSGFSEQRKYCLGILQLSLRMATRDILEPLMTFQVHQRTEYQQQYEKYCSLFETIVLDRYQNQIQACLPDLTKLLQGGSLITIGWITTLLSAVLSPKVQDGVRKLVGAWYIEFVTHNASSFHSVTEEHEFFDENSYFLLEGFLPWATQGALFTSTLMATRDSTICSHGETLSEVIARFVTSSSKSRRAEILRGILRFILDRGGRIFQYSVLYLLQGLLQGFKSKSAAVALDSTDLALITRASRLPGLPEIAGDICTLYCAELCTTLSSSALHSLSTPKKIPGYDVLDANLQQLHGPAISSRAEVGVRKLPSLQEFLEHLEASHHKSIKDDLFAPVCDDIIHLLNNAPPGSVPYAELFRALEALWDEADRQEYRRPVAVAIPPLFFHPSCVDVCIDHVTCSKGSFEEDPLTQLLTRVLRHLEELSYGRPYLLSTFIDSLRKAVFARPEILSVLPFEDLLVRFVASPPLPKKEFLFEVAAADKLQAYIEHRSYSSYYGQREWHAYACVVSLLNLFPEGQLDVAKRVFDRVLEPWRTQKKPVPIVSKWKNTFQLQAMLILSESCITEAEAEWYLESFMHALELEQWPRYRFLLEWIVSRIYHKFSHLTERILPNLAKLDDTKPIQIASLMKLAVLAAQFLKSYEFTLDFMTQLIPFSASPKVHIRHEAHWSFPIMWELAEQHKWWQIVQNPAFRALNNFIRGLDKFSRPPSTIRTLKLDVVHDFTLVGIFEGDYLTIETPERYLVNRNDFDNLWQEDSNGLWTTLPLRVPLGSPKAQSTTEAAIPIASDPDTTKEYSTPALAPLQTKSGFDLESLLPPQGPPTGTPKRPASVILVASLIDNPTNLGGLSRISESFGLEALCIDSLGHMASKDFQATAVTSHKHLPIHELKVHDVPAYLIEMKRVGYEVVGIEQTDRSGMLGQEEGTGKGGVGTLPEKCVLVLGSEKGGISAEVLAVVDRCVEIRTVGVTRSLNVQTAGGIAVYEWWREWGKGR
ncbi:uncharacterized protein EI97DRAFT_497811 [Westerdykella ornata]|uniref:tRNA/rRNA methyltransferase SpoU type domain-containing protein n=1 Tax=Westerdykella ornata TaxID=318751 RepID=A0A6A6JYH1_WESOR|nr:uncharacterized protein EI97DRAFT_497811 [Westerdykella ornata]KAF2281143.1 hypothetical protein EI97DRAFT_497811 [Westerdykella ornata]